MSAAFGWSRPKVSGMTSVMLFAIWLGLAAFGVFVLDRYSARAGEPAHAPATWPAASQLPRDPGRSTLVVIAHPRCPCTRATMNELDRLLLRSGDRLDVVVLLSIPPGYSHEWAKTDLWQTASTFPHTRVVLDDDERETNRFGSLTSGQVLFYDAGGRLRFSGGITPGRGHEGDNDGEEAVVSLAAHHSDVVASAPVYGCPLIGPTRSAGGAAAPTAPVCVK